jgi:hypothetical protein
MDIKRCFEILEVNESATPNDVERAYLDLVYVWNPKKFLNNSSCYQNVLKKVKEIETAYDRLKQYLLLKEEAERQSPKLANDDDNHNYCRLKIHGNRKRIQDPFSLHGQFMP